MNRDLTSPPVLQAYAYGGTTQGHDADKVETMKKVENRELTIRFNADTASSMTWSFRPQQREIKVRSGSHRVGVRVTWVIGPRSAAGQRSIKVLFVVRGS